jgi:hypothetical protein
VDDQKPMNPLAASIIRTVVPLAAGVLTAWLAKIGLGLDNPTVTSLLTGLFSAAYYIGVRLLEHFRSSKWGWLLGVANPPVYPKRPLRLGRIPELG